MSITHTYKRLGASRPADTNEADLYTVPASTKTIANLTVCNQTPNMVVYSVAHSIAGNPAEDEDWVAKDRELFPNTTETWAFSMAATEVIIIKSETADAISFVISGLEIS